MLLQDGQDNKSKANEVHQTQHDADNALPVYVAHTGLPAYTEPAHTPAIDDDDGFGTMIPDELNPEVPALLAYRVALQDENKRPLPGQGLSASTSQAGTGRTASPPTPVLMNSLILQVPNSAAAECRPAVLQHCEQADQSEQESGEDQSGNSNPSQVSPIQSHELSIASTSSSNLTHHDETHGITQELTRYESS